MQQKKEMKEYQEKMNNVYIKHKKYLKKKLKIKYKKPANIQCSFIEKVE